MNKEAFLESVKRRFARRKQLLSQALQAAAQLWDDHGLDDVSDVPKDVIDALQSKVDEAVGAGKSGLATRGKDASLAAVEPAQAPTLTIAEVSSLDVSQTRSLLQQYKQLEEQGEQFDENTLSIIRALVQRQIEWAELSENAATAIKVTRQRLTTALDGLVQELNGALATAVEDNKELTTLGEVGLNTDDTFRQRTERLKSAASEFAAYAQTTAAS